MSVQYPSLHTLNTLTENQTFSPTPLTLKKVMETLQSMESSPFRWPQQDPRQEERLTLHQKVCVLVDLGRANQLIALSCGDRLPLTDRYESYPTESSISSDIRHKDLTFKQVVTALHSIEQSPLSWPTSDPIISKDLSLADRMQLLSSLEAATLLIQNTLSPPKKNLIDPLVLQAMLGAAKRIEQFMDRLTPEQVEQAVKTHENGSFCVIL